MKCLECGADIYEGVKKCPYCKTLTQDFREDAKFKNFDFKYTITSPEQVEIIRNSAKATGKKAKKKGPGVKEVIEKFLSDRRAAKRAARRAVRRGEDIGAVSEKKTEANPFLRDTQVKDSGDEQLGTYTRVKKNEQKGRNKKPSVSKKNKPKMKLSFPKIDFGKISFNSGGNGKSLRRILGLGAVAVVLALLIWGIIALFGAVFGGESTARSYAYVKDNALYVVYNGKAQKVSDSVIMEEFLQKASIENAEVSAEDIAKEENLIHTTENGKVTYFFEDYDPELDRGTLCIVKNGNAKKVKKISEAAHNSVVMTKDGEKILYLKATVENGEKGALNYWKNGMKESFKITSDIDCGTFEFSKDGNWAVFIQNLIRAEKRGDLYAKNLKDLKAEKEKVDTDVCMLFGSNKDGSFHIYGKEYNTADKTFDVYTVNKKGKTMRLGQKTTIEPFVQLKKNTLFVLGEDDDGKLGTNNLYTVDIKSGKKEKVDSGVSDIVGMSEDEKILVYRKIYESSPVIADYYVYTKGKQAAKVASNVVVDETVVAGIPQIAMSGDGETVLYISDFETLKGGGVLSLTRYKNGKTETLNISENVYSCYITTDGKAVFNKNYNTTKKMFDVYTISGKEPKLLRQMVYENMFGVSETGNNIYYVSDYNQETAFGNLQRMNINGKFKNIDSKVSGFEITTKGDILVYKNVDVSSAKFDLWLIRNGKYAAKELDKGVSAVLTEGAF